MDWLNEYGILGPKCIVAHAVHVDEYETPLSTENLPWHFFFSFRESMVTTTIVSGQILMKDRQLLTLDEKEIAGKARELATKTWKRYQEYSSSAG